MEQRRERRSGYGGINLEVHRFGPPSDHLVLLLHGFMDAGGTWDLVARKLVAFGVHVIAPDQRGFGRSDRVGLRSAYHFPDYVADVDRLVADTVAPGQRLSVVGHSMGGTVAALYAGTRPERVHRLVLMEGVGPPAMAPPLGVLRMRRWLDQEAKDVAANGESTMAPTRITLDGEEDALARLQFHHRRVPVEVLRTRIPHLAQRDPDTATWSWCYDPRHRRTSPTRFDVATFCAFAAETRCPVRAVSGGPLGFHPDDEDERLAAFPGYVDRIEIPEAGHMMHWTQPAASAAAIGGFITDDHGAG